jgi:hypothetical protein
VGPQKSGRAKPHAGAHASPHAALGSRTRVWTWLCRAGLPLSTLRAWNAAPAAWDRTLRACSPVTPPEAAALPPPPTRGLRSSVVVPSPHPVSFLTLASTIRARDDPKAGGESGGRKSGRTSARESPPRPPGLSAALRGPSRARPPFSRPSRGAAGSSEPSLPPARAVESDRYAQPRRRGAGPGRTSPRPRSRTVFRASERRRGRTTTIRPPPLRRAREANAHRLSAAPFA